jgi:hypothetical protein
MRLIQPSRCAFVNHKHMYCLTFPCRPCWPIRTFNSALLPARCILPSCMQKRVLYTCNISFLGSSWNSYASVIERCTFLITCFGLSSIFRDIINIRRRSTRLLLIVYNQIIVKKNIIISWCSSKQWNTNSAKSCCCDFTVCVVQCVTVTSICCTERAQ